MSSHAAAAGSSSRPARVAAVAGEDHRRQQEAASRARARALHAADGGDWGEGSGAASADDSDAEAEQQRLQLAVQQQQQQLAAGVAAQSLVASIFAAPAVDSAVVAAQAHRALIQQQMDTLRQQLDALPPAPAVAAAAGAAGPAAAPSVAAVWNAVAAAAADAAPAAGASAEVAAAAVPRRDVPVPGASAAALGANPMAVNPEVEALRAEAAALRQQLQQQQRQQSLAPAAPDLTAVFIAMQQHQQLLIAASEKRQEQAAARTIMLQALGACPTFNGKAAPGSTGSLQAHEWILKAREYFNNRDEAMGITHATVESDRARVISAVAALIGDAHRWYSTLPEAEKPRTWNAFEHCMRERYCNGAAEERLRLDVLTNFVAAAARIREKMSFTALESYLARFQEIASGIPDSFCTIHSKLTLLAQGLPLRYAETIMKEDAKRPVPALHEVARTILVKASFKEGAAAYGGGSGATAVNSICEASPEDIALCAAAFGVSRSEASSYFASPEGWVAHSTDGMAAPGPSVAAAAHTQSGPLADAVVAQLLAAFAARAPGAGGSKGPPGQAQRRNMPSDVAKDVPEALATARKEAGLCIKCGVEWYVPGGKGHNSRTCKKAADKATTAPEGTKRAGPKPKSSDF